MMQMHYISNIIGAYTLSAMLPLGYEALEKYKYILLKINALQYSRVESANAKSKLQKH
jgi:hypothetical protein